MLSFQNKVALITGAGSGMGLATAQAFANAGANVVMADWNFESVKSAAEQLKSKGHSVLAVRCDVSDEAQVSSMIDQTVAAFGRLDAAYNNAGLMTKPAGTANTSSADFDRVISVNLKGVWLCMKYEIAQMLKQKEGGAIVNCSSIGGHVAHFGLAAYIASKHGVIGLTKVAALEYGKNHIRVNAVCPGSISTPLITSLAGDRNPADVESDLVKGIPLGRMGKPEEIADTVLWLCSERSSFVHGHSLVADGGFVIA